MGITRHWLSTRSTPTVIATSLVGGAIWGVHARVWMRFVTADPEFTWAGTLFIVGGFTVAAAVQATLFVARQSGLRRRHLTPLRIVGVASLVPLAAGAGSVMFPTIVLAATALGHSMWSAKVRGLLLALALIGVATVAVLLYQDLGFARSAVGAAWMIIIYSVIVWGSIATFGAQPDGWTAPRWLFAIGIVVTGFIGFGGLLMFGAA